MADTTIDVILIAQTEPMEFKVSISNEGKTNYFHVTLTQALFKQICGGNTYIPEHIIESVFQFLLDREPVDYILSSFDIAIVSSYFPEFDQTIRKYLG